MLPGIDQIVKALANISNFLDKELVGYCCKAGGPFGDSVEYIPGGCCVTVRMRKNNDSKYSKCLRIWHKDLPDMKERSDLVSEALQSSKLKYFLWKDYKYLKQAVKVNGNALAGIWMDWEDKPTVTLCDFLQNGPTIDQLKKLAQNFLQMCYDLNRYSFAHGDLSSNNILVKSDTHLLLIDYDSMYVPSLSNDPKRIYYQYIAGTAGYQHPKRTMGIKAGPNNDNFSQIIIYVQLLAFAKQPSLCKQIDNKALLFNGKDLTSSTVFRSSPYFKTLYALRDNDIEFYLDEVAKAIDQPLDEVKSLCELTPPSKNRQSESPKPVDDKYRRERVDTLNTQQRVSKEPKKVDGKYRYEIPKSLHIPVGKKGERCVFCNFIISNGYPQANNCPNCGAPRVTYKIAEKI